MATTHPRQRSLPGEKNMSLMSYEGLQNNPYSITLYQSPNMNAPPSTSQNSFCAQCIILEAIATRGEKSSNFVTRASLLSYRHHNSQRHAGGQLHSMVYLSRCRSSLEIVEAHVYQHVQRSACVGDCVVDNSHAHKT